ncbi:MAG: M48 family metalloprotease [Sphingomicrobium sp.]
MTSALNCLVRQLMLVLVLALSVIQPARAADVGALRDTETEALFNDIAKPLVEAAGLDPRSVHVVLLRDPEINAFVATGQTVYIQSGLMMASDNVNQLQGVIAHELGHVVGGHAVRFDSGIKSATGLTIITMVLGALAIAAGAPDAGMAISALGQQAAIGNLLTFSRAQESSADQAGALYLAKAGVSGKGSLEFFGKLQNREYRLAIYAKDSYDRTHPLSSERIAALRKTYMADPAWDRPSDAKLEMAFQRVKAKLMGFSEPKSAVSKYPESNLSIPGHYARAYAYHVSGYSDKALSETEALLAAAPGDPYFLELKGQVLLESGKPKDALEPLRAAVAATNNAPLIAGMLGHALVATEDRTNFIEAKTVLKAAVSRDNEDPFAWYQLGVIYDREGDDSRAQLATAERSNLEGKPKRALASAEIAMKGIEPGSPDWLRAQDIAMVSRAEIKKNKKRGKDEDE